MSSAINMCLLLIHFGAANGILTRSVCVCVCALGSKQRQLSAHSQCQNEVEQMEGK